MEEISKELEGLPNKAFINTIKTGVDNYKAALILSCSEQLDSLNNTTEDNQDESNDDIYSIYDNNLNINIDAQSLGNQNESNDDIRSNYVTVGDSSKTDEIALDNISDIPKTLIVNIDIQSLDEIWNFFMTYVLNMGILLILQPHSRDMDLVLEVG
ncbi:2540_t:CDS:2, partial [Dentiscutata erythropus]